MLLINRARIKVALGLKKVFDKAILNLQLVTEFIIKL